MRPTEKDSIRRAAILFVAALTFVHKAKPAGDCFDDAEVFVAEAEKRGHDPATIMSMAEALG